MKKSLSPIAVILFFISCNNPLSHDKEVIKTGTINLINYELVYKHHSALAPGTQPNGEYDDLVYCRVVGDTTISGIPVFKYRFINTKGDSSDTSMNYMQITDTSIVNLAYWGNTPLVLLKRKNKAYDSLRLEETPYATILFPYKANASWLTRPESVAAYSTKTYTSEETIAVAAGTFASAKVKTQMLTKFGLSDMWAEQWWNGLVLIKGLLNYGTSTSTDETGTVIGTAKSYETFELKEYRKLQ